MDNFKEQRKDKRLPLSIPLDVIGKHFLQFKKTGNLSLGGIFIETELLEKPGTLIEMNFIFGDEDDRARVSGEVVWVSDAKHHPGMGIKFIHPPAYFLKKIEKLYLK